MRDRKRRENPVGLAKVEQKKIERDGKCLSQRCVRRDLLLVKVKNGLMSPNPAKN